MNSAPSAPIPPTTISPGYQHCRTTPRGAFVAAHRTIYGNARLVWFRTAGDSLGYSRSWFYPDLDTAVQAMNDWDPDSERRPPDGWTREMHTGINRTEGDPAQEYYGPPTYVPSEPLVRRSDGQTA